MAWSASSPLVRTGLPGVRDLSRSLARQSLLVAAICLVADVGAMLAGGLMSHPGPVAWAVLGGVALADAALALPARLSGWVALAHAALQVGAAALLAGSAGGHHVSDAGSLIAGYRAGAWLRGRVAIAALGVLMLGVVGVQLLGPSQDGEILPVELLKNALLPWLVGRYTTSRRAYLAELEQQADNQRREALVAVEHAVAEERSAIARDLHDVISHHVSAIGMHAGAARLAMNTKAPPDAIAGSLTAVETASRSAMADLRRLLDLLHGGTADANRQPGLDNLDELLDGVRRAGQPTRLSTRGPARPVPGSLDIALYRITQEMLTNALRHGDRTPVEIELCFGDNSVSVTTRNGIPAEADSRDRARKRGGGARGLAGIRQRAALFSGTVSYGPDAAGNYWETVAAFPLGGDR